MIDVCCLGGASIDLVLEVNRLPEEGEKLPVHYLGQFAGGFIANTACACSRLGLKTAWGGFVGNDDFGQQLMQSFQEFGVQTDGILIQQNPRSDFTIILVQPDGERTILVVPIMPELPPLTNQMKSALHNSHIVYTALYDYDWFMQLASLLHPLQKLKNELMPLNVTKLAIDLEKNMISDTAITKKMLKEADYIFTDRSALKELYGQQSLLDSAREILALGPECVVVTKSNQGADAFTQMDSYTSKAYDVPVKDTSGAGDCFHAAFLYGILMGFPYQYCLDFANAAAAILIQQIGVREGLPTFQEVQRFMNKKTKGDKNK